ncbi:hypothetical protein ScPMuIL_006722 [Solemya velum]
MATQAAVYQRNLESNILFMQQEHATTLKALHEEIQTLQKKCSDLTFQLNMQGLEIGPQGPSNSHAREVEEELKISKLQKSKIEKDLVVKEGVIKELELMLKKQRMKHSEEMRHKTQEVDKLCADLETKSNAVAYLTTELHRMKRAQMENITPVLAPTPPKEAPTYSRRTQFRRSYPHRDSNDSVTPPPRINSAKSTSSSRSQSPAILVKPFLREETEPILEFLEKPPVLPPIASSSGRENSHVSQVVVRQLGKSGTTKGKGTKPIKLLAVDSVSLSDSKWAHPQESQSYEYK